VPERCALIVQTARQVNARRDSQVGQNASRDREREASRDHAMRHQWFVNCSLPGRTPNADQRPVRNRAIQT